MFTKEKLHGGTANVIQKLLLSPFKLSNLKWKGMFWFEIVVLKEQALEKDKLHIIQGAFRWFSKVRNDCSSNDESLSCMVTR